MVIGLFATGKGRDFFLIQIEGAIEIYQCLLIIPCEAVGFPAEDKCQNIFLV